MRLILLLLLTLGVYLPLAYDRPAPNYVQSSAGLALPLPADLLLALGDQYLAANFNYFRAATLPLDAPDSLLARAKFHRRAAVFNAKLEDNYYLASAGLVWQGDFDSGQFVLAKAAKARYWDEMPYFFLGANEVIFKKNYDDGARWVGLAAKVPSQNSGFFTDVSARWHTRSSDTNASIAYIKLLEANTSSVKLKRSLQLRVARLEGLKALQIAAIDYLHKQGHTPQNLQVLVGFGDLTALPLDPFGIGYELSAAGKPILTKEVK